MVRRESTRRIISKTTFFLPKTVFLAHHKFRLRHPYLFNYDPTKVPVRKVSANTFDSIIFSFDTENPTVYILIHFSISTHIVSIRSKSFIFVSSAVYFTLECVPLLLQSTSCKISQIFPISIRYISFERISNSKSLYENRETLQTRNEISIFVRNVFRN